jgi:hypothetical protein
MGAEKLYSAEEARNLREAATPGPWVLWEGHPSVFAGDITENIPFTIKGGQPVCEVDNDRRSAFDPDPQQPDDDRDEEDVCGCEEYSCRLCYPRVFADARLVAAAPDLAATVEQLHEIISGRALPPTPAEMAAHAAAGGLWLLRATDTDGTPFSFVTAGPVRFTRLIRAVALASDGRPCAWPVAPEVTP